METQTGPTMENFSNFKNRIKLKTFTKCVMVKTEAMVSYLGQIRSKINAQIWDDDSKGRGYYKIQKTVRVRSNKKCRKEDVVFSGLILRNRTQCYIINLKKRYSQTHARFERKLLSIYRMEIQCGGRKTEGKGW